MPQTCSIVIPCYNESEYIERCIRSMLEQDYPSDQLQILVCDGMSDDGTRGIVEQLCSVHSNVELLDNTHRTTPQGLNLGINHSNSDVVIIFGAHAAMDTSYVSECMRILNEKPEVGCVGGVINNQYSSPKSEFIGMAMGSSFGVGNARFRTGGKDGYVDTVAFGAYRREVFSKVGLFDEDLIRNQDDEFNFRVTSSGYEIYYSETIQSDYYVRSSVSKLWRQYRQYGYWKVFVNRKHRAVTTVRQLIPPLFVAGLIMGMILSLLLPFFWIPYVLLVMTYLTAAMFFAIGAADDVSKVFRVALIFPILHFAYGIGYLSGILDFLILGKMPSPKSHVSTR